MRRLTKNKKAYTIADIPWIAIVLGVGVIVLSITSQIVGDIRDTGKVDDTSTSINESVAHGGSLAQAQYYVSTQQCVNGTYWQDEFTLTTECNISSGGVVTTMNESTVLINYTYYTPTGEYNITLLGQRGQLKLADWIPTIGLVLGAVIVIVALSVLFTMKFRR